MPDNVLSRHLAILLVEDHADTAVAVSAYLGSLGHAVTVAASVAEAVEKVIHNQFDLIISDVGLPDGNGVSLMHGIRPFCKVPAIALTGFNDAEDVERCERAGFNRHLSKPVNPDVLKEAIRLVVSA